MCTEGAALPLPVLALSLLISSGQQAPIGSSVIQPLANGQNPTGCLWLAPSPHTTHWGTPPVRTTAFLVPAVL